jgi:hypothetical protein
VVLKQSLSAVAWSLGMSRRIDIELTSRRDDGSWTWRAPGARQPKGSLDGSLLPSSAKVGDVLRAEADFDIEGIVVVSVQGHKADERDARTAARIEVLGSGRDNAEGVSVTLAPGGRRHRDDFDGERRPRRAPGERGGRSSGPPRSSAGRSDEGRPRPERPRAASDGPGRGERESGGAGERTGRAERGPATRRTGRPDEGAGRPDAGRPDAGRPDRRPREDRPQRRERPRRPEPVATHRNAALAALGPEQIAVAEQLLRGGIPAVRQAIDEQNARARSEGRPEVPPQPLLTLAEELLPRMNLAAWKDRAVALRTAGKDAPLREVRSVVAGASTVTLDDEGREVLSTLREALESRVAALRQAWLARVTTALDDNRVAEALRVSARPPEPSARVPADLAVRLADAAGTAMAPTVGEVEWIDLLDAVVNSPVRRTVKPSGLPAAPSGELLTAARHAAGLVPELARLLGLPIPPPPGPRRVGAVAARRI